MGLAEAGVPLSHEDTMKWAPHVRKHGIIQFINLYRKAKNRKNDGFKWGDEIEYTLVKFDEKMKEAKLSLRSIEILEELNKETNRKSGYWTPEYGAFMIEGTPAKPYEGLNVSFVEENMKRRRKEVKKLLKSDEDLMCITSFPRMGCDNFTYPIAKPTPDGGLTKSRFFPDACIFPGHPRYHNTTKNIMGRRGEKPYYNLPIFKDKHTKIPVDDCYQHEKNALPDHVYLDSMGFGCGYSCIQATFQAADVNEARLLYDQLAPFCPIMIALTAAAPFHRGFITDVDTRWNILCNTQDCRTKEEKGLKPLKNNKFVINKSRHDSIDCYISPEGEKYNDQPIYYNKEDYQKLIDNGVDSCLAKHIAHLFIRDTISMFEEKIHQNDDEESDHFENIQSTVWQSMRFKPPPPNTSIGWRVEFRPCDVQITDFENAAVVSFLAVLTRIILTYKLNFLIPISKIDENIQRAQKRNAIHQQKFWFRRQIFKNNEFTKHGNMVSNRNVKNELTKYPELNGKTGKKDKGLSKQDIKENLKIKSKIMPNGIKKFTYLEDIEKNGIKLENYITSNGKIYVDNEALTNNLKEKRRNSLKLKNETIGNKNFKNRLSFNEFIKNKPEDFENILMENDINENRNISVESLEDSSIFNGIIKHKSTSNGFTENENKGILKNESIEIEDENLERRNMETDVTDYFEMTVDEIINGKGEHFPGIISLMKKYVDDIDMDVTTYCDMQRYLRLIEGRASGKILTPSTWMRQFAMEHPDYRHDSVVTEKINFDLLKTIVAIQNGKIDCPELLGQSIKK